MFKFINLYFRAKFYKGRHQFNYFINILSINLSSLLKRNKPYRKVKRKKKGKWAGKVSRLLMAMNRGFRKEGVIMSLNGTSNWVKVPQWVLCSGWYLTRRVQLLEQLECLRSTRKLYVVYAISSLSVKATNGINRIFRLTTSNRNEPT